MRAAQVQALARGNQQVAGAIGADINTLTARMSAQDAKALGAILGSGARTAAAIDRNTAVTRPRALPINLTTNLNVSAREIASEVTRVVVGNRFVAS